MKQPFPYITCTQNRKGLSEESLWLIRLTCNSIGGTFPFPYFPKNLNTSSWVWMVVFFLTFPFNNYSKNQVTPQNTCACTIVYLVPTLVRDVIPRFWEDNIVFSRTILCINGFRWLLVQNEAEWTYYSLDLWGSDNDIINFDFSWRIVPYPHQANTPYFGNWARKKHYFLLR